MILGKPDAIWALTDAALVSLVEAGGIFGGGSVEVRLVREGERLRVAAFAPGVALKRIAIRWDMPLPRGARVLGDAWERGYGDLEWRGCVPERALPWYALILDPARDCTIGLGVETGSAAGALAFWRVDEAGVTLVLDTRCGGVGVRLGQRVLDMAVVRTIEGLPGRSAFAVARALCHALCPAPRLPRKPVFGGNDWYYAYGRSSAETVRRDAALLRELAPRSGPAPHQVIDAGWEPNGRVCDGGPYDRANERFGDLAALAGQIANMQVEPGIWIRPLLANLDVPAGWRLPEGHPVLGSSAAAFLDPSMPEVVEHVRADIHRLTEWGYRLIKHDFTTFDVTGRWGFLMGESVTADGWAFADRTRTTAEVLHALYEAIREAAGDAVIIGCNTIGHLGAGLFEVQRTGDDTSGREWERTRKMGVNTLAFRLPQHSAFFLSDADCVGLTTDVAWEHNRQWLDAVARSGTPLFVSADPAAVGSEQRADLRDAFARAADPCQDAEPLDWTDTTCPRRWRFGADVVSYDWGCVL